MSPIPEAGEVRERILTDHVLLRALMRDVAMVAKAALADEKRRPDVRAALGKLRTELERHLEYEDTFLDPLLRDADAWGAVRATHMANDHAGQRAVLVALTEDAAEGVRSVEALAEELGWFLRSFERDMREEEEMLLSPEALGQEPLAVDQTDG